MECQRCKDTNGYDPEPLQECCGSPAGDADGIFCCGCPDLEWLPCKNCKGTKIIEQPKAAGEGE